MALELTQEQKDAGWLSGTLEEFLTLIIDHRGKTPKKLGGDWSESGHRVISAINMKNSRVDGNDHHYVDDEIFAKWMKIPVAVGDVFLTSEAPMGAVAYISDHEATDWVVGQRIFALRADEKQLHGRYLYYLLQTNNMKEQLESRSSGTTVMGIKQAELRKVELILQPVEEQKRIAEILGSVDDKIEANSRLIDSLLKLALVVFSSAKSRNETKVLDTLFKDFVGGDWGKEENDGSLFPVYEIRGADIPNLQKGGIGKLPLRYIKESSLKRRSLEPGDVVVEGSGGSPTQCTGRPALITQELIDNYDYPLVATNFCKIIKPMNQELGKSVYLGILDSWNSGELWQYETGTTGIKNLNFSLFASVKQIPDFDDSKYYLDLLAQIGQENSELMKIRGFLIRYLIG